MHTLKSGIDMSRWNTISCLKLKHNLRVYYPGTITIKPCYVNRLFDTTYCSQNPTNICLCSEHVINITSISQFNNTYLLQGFPTFCTSFVWFQAHIFDPTTAWGIRFVHLACFIAHPLILLGFHSNHVMHEKLLIIMTTVTTRIQLNAENNKHINILNRWNEFQGLPYCFISYI